MLCAGFLSVPADGLYTLSLRSRDASELKVDGETAIVNESVDYVRRRAERALRKGLHPVEIRYVLGGYMGGLELKMDAPGKPLAPVPPNRLFHAKDTSEGRP